MTYVNRKYKDRIFRLLFADEKNKSNTLALYNALNNSAYTDENELEITTIEDAIYIKMKTLVTIQHRPNHLLMRPYDSDSGVSKSHLRSRFSWICES